MSASAPPPLPSQKIWMHAWLHGIKFQKSESLNILLVLLVGSLTHSTQFPS